MKKLFFSAILGAMALSASAQDATNEMWWGYYSDQAQSITGNYKLGTYEAFGQCCRCQGVGTCQP